MIDLVKNLKKQTTDTLENIDREDRLELIHEERDSSSCSSDESSEERGELNQAISMQSGRLDKRQRMSISTEDSARLDTDLATNMQSQQSTMR